MARVLDVVTPSSLDARRALARADALCQERGVRLTELRRRVLEFLLEQGLIHRLASLNVFIGCRQPDSCHGGQFLICQDCGQVDELSNPAVEELLGATAAARDFEVLTQRVEVLGRCPDCRRGAASHAG